MKPIWEQNWNAWTSKSAFITWLRSALRKLWSRHPVKTMLKLNNRKKLPNEKGREVFHHQCAMCLEWKPTKEIQVDHVTPNPPLRDLEDLPAYVENLLVVGLEDVRLLCIPCHKQVTKEQRAKR